MTDPDIQAKLDKLARIEERSRERSRKFLERAKESGKKQISAIVNGEAYEELCRRRDAAIQAGKLSSFGHIIERALLSGIDVNKNTNENVNINDTINQDQKPTPDEGQKSAKPIRETQTEIPGPKPEKDMELPDYLIDVNPNIPIEKRHKIILRLAEDFPDRKNAQIRIDLLNAAGILLGGKPWEKTKQFGDQLSKARRWAKKK